MELHEMIECLKKIEETFGGYIKVRIKYLNFDENPLITIVTEKQHDGERIVLLE